MLLRVRFENFRSIERLLRVTSHRMLRDYATPGRPIEQFRASFGRPLLAACRPVWLTLRFPDSCRSSSSGADPRGDIRKLSLALRSCAAPSARRAGEERLD